MKKAALFLLSAAPGIAAGYVLLAGYLLNRIRPIPITLIADSAAGATVVVPPMYRRSAGIEPDSPRERVGV